MDFFEQQDQAHRQSRKLLFLFMLALVAIVLAVNASLALIWIWRSGASLAGQHVYPRGFFVTNTVLTLLFIGAGTLFEMFRLRDGGDAVALLAGGRLVMPSSADVLERRLLNVVEEMALASGIACPRVYIMDDEQAINAFAAGYHQNQAVLAVTHGSLTRLSRDELQGVIGHEFSHIMNGDMRMNVKLIGVLFGIQMIATLGQELMYWGTRFGSSRSRDEKGPPLQLILLALGAALFVIGYVGIFFGRLIKSAVSRQREFLADASSVQFTRNPDGIGGALRKIGGLTRSNDCGSRIDNPHAEQLSHMFLGAARPNLLSGLFATHPPLTERLRRVYGKSVDFLDASELPESGFADSDAVAMPDGAVGFSTGVSHAAKAPATKLSAAGALAFGHHASAQSALSAEVLAAARDPLAATALVYALLLDQTAPAAYQLQIDVLRLSVPLHSALAISLLEQIESLPRSARLPLLDLAMPALSLLSAGQRSVLLGVVSRLIAADQRVTQAEFVLQTVLERRLAPQAGRAVTARYGDLAELTQAAALTLSLMAQTAGGRHGVRAAFMRAAISMPQLALSEADLSLGNAVDFFAVRQALDQLNQLAPLAKPFLIRLLLVAAGSAISVESADLLRGICAAIDAPVPDSVAQTYTAHHWAYSEPVNAGSIEWS